VLKISILSLQNSNTKILNANALKEIETELNKYKTMSKTDAKEFKKLMFGRKTDNSEISLYNRILQTPGNEQENEVQLSNLINLISKNFGLWKKGYITNLVRIGRF
jgi:flagellar biosynthesis protein FliP